MNIDWSIYCKILRLYLDVYKSFIHLSQIQYKIYIFIEIRIREKERERDIGISHTHSIYIILFIVKQI